MNISVIDPALGRTREFTKKFFSSKARRDSGKTAHNRLYKCITIIVYKGQGRSKLGGMAKCDQGRTASSMSNSFLDSYLSSRLLLARMVGRIVRPDDVEDILQETFISTYAASRSRRIDNQQAFMVRVARNLALDHVKRAGIRTTSSLEDVDEASLISDLNLERNHQIQEQFLEFCRVVAELPSSCRRVFILKKVYGLTLEEIAVRLNISTSTVEKHVAKGLAFVIEHMRVNGHTSVPVALDKDKGRLK